MEDIMTKAEQLGHEAEGLHFFTYHKISSNPIITERIIGVFQRVERDESGDNETYLLFKDDTSSFGVAYFPSFIEKLLSGKEIESKKYYMCRDRTKLEARIERQREVERQRKIREKVESADWEARTWELFRNIAVANFSMTDNSLILANGFLITFARKAVEEYKKSMEEEE